MLEDYIVKCNMCNWEGDEEELIIVEEIIDDDHRDFYRGCPNCETDAYLMDIPID